jgi:hypothetical protein
MRAWERGGESGCRGQGMWSALFFFPITDLCDPEVST